MRHSALLAALILSTLVGCNPAVKLTLRNPSQVALSVSIENTDENERPKRGIRIVIPAATLKLSTNTKVDLDPNNRSVLVPGEMVVNWQNIPRLSKIKITYSTDGSVARASYEPPLIVHDSSDLFDSTITLGRLELFDPSASQETILALGTSLSASRKLVSERLIDVMPILGAVVVATFSTDESAKTEVADVHGSVHIQDIKIEYSNPLEVRSSTATTQSIVAKAAVTVPIYGNVSSSMATDQYYNLSWAIKHYPYLNSTFNLGAALRKASFEELDTIKALLDANKDAVIAVVHGMHVIESASFGLTEGRKLAAGANMAIASMLTADAAYEFRLSDEKFVTLPSLVVDISYSKQRNRAAAVALIDRLIEAKKPGPPSSPPPSQTTITDLAKRVSEGLQPVDVSNDSQLNKKVIETVNKDIEKPPTEVEAPPKDVGKPAKIAP